MKGQFLLNLDYGLDGSGLFVLPDGSFFMEFFDDFHEIGG